MSQIGFVKQESMTVKRDGKETPVKWLEAYFRVGGLRPFSAKIVKNNRKENMSHPDFHIYLRANVNKGDKFRDIRIGALWLKTKKIDNVEKTFMTGNIFMDFREYPIAVWKALPRYEGEVVEYLYDISVMKDRIELSSGENAGQGYEVVYEAAPVPTDSDIPVDPNEEIPF